MQDEIKLAFDSPEARAQATSGPDPLDRIAVRDYVVDCEIGAFQAERGVTQRIKFNVVLEVGRSAAAQFDDVDQVLSYDTITEAIDHQLSVERVNLLETLAERIAEEILFNPRAVRVFIRIEKLDRIPGTLGIEIARTRAVAENLVAVEEKPVVTPEVVHPLVVFMPNAALYSNHLSRWLNKIDAYGQPAVICLEETPQQRASADHALAERRIALLAIEQNAWVLAARDARCVVVDSRTEMDWAIKQGQMSVWAPSKMVLDSFDKPKGAEDPLALAQWFAREFSADHVTVLGAYPSAKPSASLRILRSDETI